MPLKSGSGKAAVAANIKTEKAAGKPQAQAVAIALHKAGDASYRVAQGMASLSNEASRTWRVTWENGSRGTVKAATREAAMQRAAQISTKPVKTLEAADADCSIEMDESTIDCDADLDADEQAADRAPAIHAHDRMPLNFAPIARDRAAHRVDTDGHLHIDNANISKAMVCPYLGAEIPGSDTLGLEPSKIYMLYRDAAELEAAAPTYENKPLMADHIVVSAEQPYKHYIAGTVSDVKFRFPYLVATVTVWDGEAMKRIQSGEQAEISCGYKYRADMTPGEFEGQKYDGVMRELACNHIALVAAGRCGPDVTAAET